MITSFAFLLWLNQPNFKTDFKTTNPTNGNKNGNNPAGFKKVLVSIGSIRKDFAFLEEAGIIKNAAITLKLLSLLGLDKELKAGTYELDNQMSLMDIVEKLLSGQEETLRLTILEGQDLYDVGESLAKKKIVSSREAFLRITSDPKTIDLAKKKLGLNNITSLEGFLYPDTYEVRYGDSIANLIDSSLSNFRDKVIVYLDEKNIPEKDRLGLFVISSLVEKETILEREKPIIAGVVYNRLRENMKLRFDPTIIYALKEKGLYDENLVDGKINIRTRHFTLKSQFNTYYTRELPPHPISNFTLSSLKAALNPEKHQFIFFVSKSKKNHSEGHDFSITYAEHLAKIEKYRNK